MTTLPLWLIPVDPARRASRSTACSARGSASRSSRPSARRRRASRPSRAYVAPDPVLRRGTTAPIVEPVTSWIAVGDLSIDVAFRLDPLSALMLSFVTFVGLPHPRLLDRLHAPRRDRRRLRALLRVPEPLHVRDADARPRRELPPACSSAGRAWGSARTCSIGYYFDQEYAAAAGQKAFVVNRIGDFGFLLGDVRHLRALRLARTTPRSSGKARRAARAASPRRCRAICLCLFVGAMGKSAQVPLYVWLPDAMAGPTPVSALIHAATMVTAGVYMVARCNVLFRLAPEVDARRRVHRLLHRDLRRHDRASRRTTSRRSSPTRRSRSSATCSSPAASAPSSVGMFHVMTHAFFKACLFLGSGSVIHAMGGEQDIRQMGGLKAKMPITYWTFLVGDARDRRASRRSPASSRRTRSSSSAFDAPEPRQAALGRRAPHGRADRLLHVPRSSP